jgi:hypothetical protein
MLPFFKEKVDNNQQQNLSVIRMSFLSFYDIYTIRLLLFFNNKLRRKAKDKVHPFYSIKRWKKMDEK